MEEDSLNTALDKVTINTSSGPVTKDDTHWFEDGNVVLIADTVQPAVAFRVYKGLLARASPVFREMFSSTSERTEDGTAIVRIPEAPEAILQLLNHVAPPSTGEPDTSTPEWRFETLASVIRLGVKYQVPKVIAAGKARLRLFFTGTPWAGVSMTWDTLWEARKREAFLSLDLEDAIEAVALIRLLDMPDLVPFALYLCCLDPLMLRRDRQSGVQLTDDDFERCVTASALLAQECLATVHKVLHTCPSACEELYDIDDQLILSCLCKKGCQKAVQDLGEASFKNRKQHSLSTLFTRLGHRVAEWGAYSDSLCYKCRAHILDTSQKNCEETMMQLPKFFGFLTEAESLREYLVGFKFQLHYSDSE